MRRFHLIELHEQSWYPDSWRKIFQLALGKVYTLHEPADSLMKSLGQFLTKTRPSVVLELCSGSGEFSLLFWEKATASLDGVPRPKLLLSDLYPNVESFRKLTESTDGQVGFLPQSVNALDPPEMDNCVLMMVESLHHFRPTEVREILGRAAGRARGFVAIELTQRTWKNLAFVVLAAPFLSAILTVFKIKPFRLRNLLWGLLIPVIPATFVFDSIVSNLRSYTVSELEEIIHSIGAAGFEWSTGTIAIPNTPGLKLTYLFGCRDAPSAP